MVTGGVTDPGAGLLAIFDCSTGDPTRRTYQQAYETLARAVFHLPQFARTAQYARIDLYGNPYSSHGPSEKPEVPFVYDRNSRLLVFEIAVLVSGRCAWNYYMMFISAETIECHSKHNDVPATKTIGWADWAMETRIITGHRMIYSAHISHMRCLYHEQEDRPIRPGDPKPKLVLFEFASLPLLRRELSGQGERVAQYFMEPSVINHPEVLASTVKTALPYRRTVSDISFWGHEIYLISDDCVIIKEDVKSVSLVCLDVNEL